MSYWIRFGKYVIIGVTSAILIFIILKIHKRMKRDFKRWLSDCIKMNCVFMIYSRRLRNYVKVLKRSIGIKREFHKLQDYERYNKMERHKIVVKGNKAKLWYWCNHYWLLLSGRTTLSIYNNRSVAPPTAPVIIYRKRSWSYWWWKGSESSHCL